MLALTTVFLFVKGDFDFGAPAYPAESNVFSVCFYVGFNMFLSAAVIVRAGGRKQKTRPADRRNIGRGYGCIYRAHLRRGQLRGDKRRRGRSAARRALFLFRVYVRRFRRRAVRGALTTVVCSYYPLSEAVSRKSRMFSVMLAVGVFLFSRIGVKTIVGAAYPAAGVLGALYFIYAAVVSAYKNKPFGKIKNKEKNKEKENAEKKEKDKSSPPFRRGLQ